MKKLILTFVAVLAGTYLFAQDNDSYITQINDNSHADVTQTGYENYSNVYQTGYYWSEPRNEAYVKQTGKWNYSSIEQYGEGNTFDARQTGKNNYIGGAFGSSAYQAGDLNHAKVHQDGEWLESYSSQVGYKNWIEVYQSGNQGQMSYIAQNGSRNGAVVHQSN